MVVTLISCVTFKAAIVKISTQAMDQMALDLQRTTSQISNFPQLCRNVKQLSAHCFGFTAWRVKTPVRFSGKHTKFN